METEEFDIKNAFYLYNNVRKCKYNNFVGRFLFVYA